MYLKMLLSGQLIEERFIPDANVYSGDFLQQQIEELINDHEQTIEACGEQPQFTVTHNPSVSKKKTMLAAVYSRMAFLHHFFGS